MTTHATVTIGDILADINPLEMAGMLVMLTAMNAERVGDHETVEAFELEMRNPASPVAAPVRMLMQRLVDASDLYGFTEREIDRAMNDYAFEITSARERVVRRHGGTPTFYSGPSDDD